PYQAGIIPKNVHYLRRSLVGEVVAVMAGHIDSRGLKLIPQPTRALRKYDIVELIATEEKPNNEGTINSISYIGFFEIKKGGVVKKGDYLMINDKFIGEIVGYDETHSPNHLNMIVEMENKQSGKEMHIDINNKVKINMN